MKGVVEVRRESNIRDEVLALGAFCNLHVQTKRPELFVHGSAGKKMCLSAEWMRRWRWEARVALLHYFLIRFCTTACSHSVTRKTNRLIILKLNLCYHCLCHTKCSHFSGFLSFQNVFTSGCYTWQAACHLFATLLACWHGTARIEGKKCFVRGRYLIVHRKLVQ